MGHVALQSLTSHLHGRKPREVTDRDLRAVARFLRMTPGLSRKVIGDLLGENCERCKRLLMIYASTFEFAGARCLACCVQQRWHLSGRICSHHSGVIL